MWSDWKVYERDGTFFGAFESHMEGFFGVSPIEGKEYYYIDRAFVGFKGRHLYWCYGQSEFRTAAFRWITRWVREGVEGSFVRTATRRYRTCMHSLAHLLHAPLPKDRERLIAYYNAINFALLLHTRTTAISVDSFDDYFAEVFSMALKNAGKGKVCDDKEAWSALLTPAYRSVLMDYKLSLLGARNREEVRAIWEKYFWLTMGWSGTAPLTPRAIEKERVSLRASPRCVVKERAAILHTVRQVAQRRAAVIKRFAIPRKLIMPYLSILDAFARLHDERKEIQMRTLYAMDRVRHAVAHRFRVAFFDVQMLNYTELCALLRTGALPRGRVQKRKIGYYRLYRNGHTAKECAGREACVLIDRALAISDRRHQTVKGVVASLGRAIGRTVVTDDPKEAIRLVKKGDILITSMTTPDFVPAIKRAGAIVTNEGGVTSHAAIVSRELGIPCVIGTIIATKVFKDGDRVEVDAVKGIIRKL